VGVGGGRIVDLCVPEGGRKKNGHFLLGHQREGRAGEKKEISYWPITKEKKGGGGGERMNILLHTNKGGEGKKEGGDSSINSYHGGEGGTHEASM